MKIIVVEDENDIHIILLLYHEKNKSSIVFVGITIIKDMLL